MSSEPKSVNVEVVHRQAYTHPKFAALRLGHFTQCPNCGSEHVMIVKVTHTGGHVHSCQNCFSLYETLGMVA